MELEFVRQDAVLTEEVGAAPIFVHSRWHFKLRTKAFSEFGLEIKPPSEGFFLVDTARQRTALRIALHLLTQ
jgi:hypothetical protein